jgi:hypothetical protein
MSGMFDEFTRELRQLSRPTTFSVPILPDEKGYIDRECPMTECRYVFKVKSEDWEAHSKTGPAWCPRCGHNAPADNWHTSAQLEHAKCAALRHVEGRIGSALQRDAIGFNSRQPRGGFFRMSMSYRGPTGLAMMLSAAAREALEQEVQCEQCGIRFAILGCAFFCPCCGHNSVERDFDAALRRITASMGALDAIRRSVAEATDPDAAETTCRALVESSLSDCVGAFQALCDGLYARLPSASPPPRNAFQRLNDGSDLWREAVGVSYSDLLEADELKRLHVCFQRRHLFAHTGGFVDEDYVSKSGDPTYRIGQRIVVTAANITDAVSVIGKLADGLRSSLAAQVGGASQDAQHEDGGPYANPGQS